MGDTTKISWCDKTFNTHMGCTKVSPACANCYAERDMDLRYGKVKWGPQGTRVLTSDENWKKPIRWNKEAGEKGIRYRVFCASLADIFEEWEGPIVNSNWNTLFISPSGEWIPDDLGCGFVGEDDWQKVTMNDVRKRLFELIDSTPNLDWLLLTKRPENILKMWPERTITIKYRNKKQTPGLAHAHPNPFKHETKIIEYQPVRNNVWLGTTVENQEYADKRIAELLKCRHLAPVLFLSCEPLLGPVKIKKWLWEFDRGASSDIGAEIETPSGNIDWVIAGGESGPNARPANPDWYRSLRDQCKNAGVPFHFKQWGEYGETENGMIKLGIKKTGSLLDGVDWKEFPNVFKFRKGDKHVLHK